MSEEGRTGEELKASQAEAVGSDTLAFPNTVAKRLGLTPGARLSLVIARGRVEVMPNIHSLARVYIEPSSRCNLSCRTCIRQTWDETQGDMAPKVFKKLIEDLRQFPHLDSVMLGGFGEPTMHPDMLSMISDLKALKIRVEMVSNGTLLDERMLEGLFKSRLDRLWISFDGAEDFNFEHIREGASFEGVVQNLKRLRKMNRDSAHKIAVGIAFVVTRKNISDIKGISKLAKRVGADRVSISNVIPYSPDMARQMVCSQALTLGEFASLPEKTEIDLPRVDVNESTKESLWQLATQGDNLSIMGNKVGARVDECRFIRERYSFIRWDGKVAPCMALLHTHETYFQGYKKRNRCYLPGDITRQGLLEIWASPEYAAFREKVSAFDFSPCHICGGCDLVDENKADCGGNTFPTTCGGCLWAQGIIQCP